jgi:hypothetical protein
MNAYDEVLGESPNRGAAAIEANTVPYALPLTNSDSAEKPKRRKTVQAQKTTISPSSVASHSSNQEDKQKATSAAQPTERAPSASPIPRKRGRPSKDPAKPIGGSSGAANSADHENHETRLARVDGIQEGCADQKLDENPEPAVGAALLKVWSGWRMRQRWHKAEKSLILQGKAFCRGYCDGDKDRANALFDAAFKEFLNVMKGESEPTKELPFEVSIALDPFFVSLKKFQDERKKLERDLDKTARTLPTYEWAMAVPGFGAGSFLSIIGEATVVELDGSLRTIGDYHSVAGLWKRMGVAIINGERQRKRSDAEEALLHGYSPARRSALWNIGGGLIGGMGRGYRPLLDEDISVNGSLSHYQKMFVARLRYLAARDPEKFAKEPVLKKNKAGEQETRESFTLACAASAKRYVEKKFLRDLYARWRFETRGEVVDPETEWMNQLPLAAE